MRYSFIFILLFFLTFIAQAQKDTLFNQTDTHNLKQGWWKKSYPNGKLMYKGYFKDNKPAGEMRRYFETGELKAKLDYDSNGEYAHARLYYADGHLAAKGCYYNSLKDSIWSYYSYYDHTLTAREIFVKGIRDGTMVLYYSNGNPSEKITWSRNKKEGTWEQYFINRILKLKGSYHDGKLDGGFLVNYEKGNPYIMGSYRNDQREGKWTFYKENGTVDLELQYHEGLAPDESKLDDKQKQFFHMIDENRGKFNEPDETNFLNPGLGKNQ
jgi:antitoxin component YwqK of YwqJK toxin-antitoxin module